MDDAELLVAIKNHIAAVRREVAAIIAERETAQREYAATCKRLDERAALVQQRCPHTEIQHHPDASGNNDSWDECHVCGAIL